MSGAEAKPVVPWNCRERISSAVGPLGQHCSNEDSPEDEKKRGHGSTCFVTGQVSPFPCLRSAKPRAALLSVCVPYLIFSRSLWCWHIVLEFRRDLKSIRNPLALLCMPLPLLLLLTLAAFAAQM